MKRLHELSPSLEAAELLAALTRLGPNYLELGRRCEAAAREIVADIRAQRQRRQRRGPYPRTY